MEVLNYLQINILITVPSVLQQINMSSPAIQNSLFFFFKKEKEDNAVYSLTPKLPSLHYSILQYTKTYH